MSRNIPSFGADGDSNFIKADSGITGGVFRKEREDTVTLGDAVSDGSPPVIPELEISQTSSLWPLWRWLRKIRIDVTQASPLSPVHVRDRLGIC